MCRFLYMLLTLHQLLSVDDICCEHPGLPGNLLKGWKLAFVEYLLWSLSILIYYFILKILCRSRNIIHILKIMKWSLARLSVIQSQIPKVLQMVTQQCECTLHHWTLHLKMAKMVFHCNKKNCMFSSTRFRSRVSMIWLVCLWLVMFINIC